MNKNIARYINVATLTLAVVLMSGLPSYAASPASVNLGTAGNFVILAKSGISTVPTSAVTGDVGRLEDSAHRCIVRHTAKPL